MLANEKCSVGILPSRGNCINPVEAVRRSGAIFNVVLTPGIVVPSKAVVGTMMWEAVAFVSVVVMVVVVIVIVVVVRLIAAAVVEIVA